MTDHQMDEIIGKVLRFGVSLAAVVVGCGGIWYLIRNGMSIPDYHAFRGEPTDLRSLRGIAGGAPGSGSRRLIQLGILILIATPVTRVAFSVVAFALERDRVYVAITVFVLAVLVFSLTGLAG